MVKGDKIRADRTPWTDELTKTFLEICIEEKRAGNMDGYHLNSFGKKHLLEKFNQRTNKGYDEGQLSRKWSTQKALWVAWQKLLLSATGLGRANGTVSAPDEWWVDKIKVDKKYRTFRYAPLQYKELHEELFADVVATDPRSYLVPPNSGNPEGEYDYLPDT